VTTRKHNTAAILAKDRFMALYPVREKFDDSVKKAGIDKLPGVFGHRNKIFVDPAI